jgi:hypothetical protein
MTSRKVIPTILPTPTPKAILTLYFFHRVHLNSVPWLDVGLDRQAGFPFKDCFKNIFLNFN